jgi:hypothetical protein
MHCQVVRLADQLDQQLPRVAFTTERDMLPPIGLKIAMPRSPESAIVSDPPAPLIVTVAWVASGGCQDLPENLNSRSSGSSPTVPRPVVPSLRGPSFNLWGNSAAEALSIAGLQDVADSL